MKVDYTRHDLGELKVMDEQEGKLQGNHNELTNRKRFASGWDFA